MGSGVPLLNDYKQEFFLKRLPQTVLGGPKLKIGYKAPLYVYYGQIIIFLTPWILGGICTILVEFVNLDVYGTYICGGSIFLYSFCINIICSLLKSQGSVVKTIQEHVLAEEDEIQFDSCCGFETINFIVPGKKYKINILLHSIIAGLVGGIGFRYVLPQTINALYTSNLTATVLIYIFGWFTLLVGLYALIVAPPPEPALYRTVDVFETSHLMRPFYMMIFFSFDLIASYETGFLKTNQILHVVFLFLPLFWSLGILPPLDALFYWLLEQALVVLFGGSPMASDLRLVVIMLVSMVVVFALYYIPYGLVTVVLMALFGYILSTDLGSLGSQISQFCKRNNEVSPESERSNWKIRFLGKWGIKEFIFHLFMLILAAAMSGGLNYLVNDDASITDYAGYLAYICMGLLAVEVILSEVQSVYVFFGLLRNKLYPASAQRTRIFHAGKRRLKVFGYLRRIIINFVSPFVMLAYLSLSINFTDSASVLSISNETVSDAAQIIGSNRAFRWIWQSTQNSLFEISVYQILNIVLPDNSDWMSLGIGVQLMIISFCRDRLSRVCNKLYFWLLVVVMSWRDKKQRRDHTAITIGLNILLFPLVLGVIALASALSAPLLPLFTLPVFLMGFPRPYRSWPEAVGSSANICPDTTYYRQFAPHLAEAIKEAYSFGSLGEPHPGRQLLVRFQDRLAWVVVLERGYMYCSLSIKGLELQETSCHTVEAARLDDMFEVSFEKEGGFSFCSWNQFPLSVLQPYDAAYVKTYSDAKNVLTGVIDSPEALKQIDTGFIQALVWVILHHIKEEKDKGNTNGISIKSAISSHEKRLLSINNWQKLEEEMESTLNLQKIASAPERDIAKSDGEFRPTSARSRSSSRNHQRTPSVKSFSSNWSDDNESLILEPIERKNKVNLVSGYTSRYTKGIGQNDKDVDMLPPVMTVTPKKDLRSELELFNWLPESQKVPGLLDSSLAADGFFAELEGSKSKKKDASVREFEDFDFGLPALDNNQAKLKNVSTMPNQMQPEIRATNPGYACKTDSNLLVPPVKWQRIPVEESKLKSLADRFPRAWYKHVLGLLDIKVDMGKSVDDMKADMGQDESLEKVYNRLIMACYAIVNILGVGGMDSISLGTNHVHKVYSGDIPWSPASDFLLEDKELLELVLKAYRYSVKMGIDQQLLGEISSYEELQDYMEEYDKDWYIGLENDPGWAQAILCNKLTLFSLGHNSIQGTYTSRTLSNQDVLVYIGTLNDEVVRGQWANLALELFYLTNDDEERYSIQAHATTLRNLTVQAADPPLGYPIYASAPITIPTL